VLKKNVAGSPFIDPYCIDHFCGLGPGHQVKSLASGPISPVTYRDQ
jgi:hypothetical protein